MVELSRVYDMEVATVEFVWMSGRVTDSGRARDEMLRGYGVR